MKIYAELVWIDRRIVLWTYGWKSQNHKIKSLWDNILKGITQMSEAVSTAGSVVDAAGMKFSTFAASTGKIAEKTRQEG